MARDPRSAFDRFLGTGLNELLAPGETSDGLPEALTPDGGPLGYERFEALLAQAGDADALLEAVRAATGPTLSDDWTFLLLERTR